MAGRTIFETLESEVRSYARAFPASSTARWAWS
jgi:hypothetical protein